MKNVVIWVMGNVGNVSDVLVKSQYLTNQTHNKLSW